MREILGTIRNRIPRVFVNLVEMFDVSKLWVRSPLTGRSTNGGGLR
jgi:hypothetical protein